MAKKKFESLDNIFESSKIRTTAFVKKYQSNYDYSNIIEDDKEKLMISEEDIVINRDEVNKSYFKIAKNLYESNQILASYDNTNGKFINWFETLGLKKTFVYNSIKRYELFLLINDESKINSLSQKAVEMIGSKKIDDFSKIKLLKTEGIEKINDRILKNQILDIISERSEMIGIKETEENVEMKFNLDEMEKQFTIIKKLLNKTEAKLLLNITKTQWEKLKRIEEILKDI